MAIRKPLVLVAGVPVQLPDNDMIALPPSLMLGESVYCHPCMSASIEAHGMILQRSGIVETNPERFAEEMGIYSLTYREHALWMSGQVSAITVSEDDVIVFGGGAGTLSVSQDGGANWINPSHSLGTSLNFTAAASGNGVICLGTSNGKTIFSSDKGVSWQVSQTTLPSKIENIAYGDGVFVAVGSAYTAWSHAIGVPAWTLASNLSFSNSANTPMAVAYGAGVFVVTGGAAVAAYSSDRGATWSSTAGYLTGGSNSETWRNLVFSDDFGFVAVQSSTSGRISTSLDGRVWRTVTGSMQGVSGIATYPVLCRDMSGLLLISAPGVKYYSVNATDWLSTYTNIEFTPVRAASNGRLVAVGGASGKVATGVLGAGTHACYSDKGMMQYVRIK